MWGESGREEFERRQRDDVHGDRQEQARVEEKGEQLAVELQVHEVRHHDEELDTHECQQHRQESRAEIDEVRRHFERSQAGENRRDLDIARDLHAMFGMFVVAVLCVFCDCG